jgi:translation initiation factor IF-1
VKEDDLVATEGVVVEHIRGGFFRVRIGDHVALCRVNGRLDKHKIRILKNDKVAVELAPPDYGKGRITYRLSVEE